MNSNVRKKRNTSKASTSSSLLPSINSKNSTAVSPTPTLTSLNNCDLEDDKNKKLKPLTMSGKVLRFWFLFAVIICLIFYDSVQVHKAIYTSVFEVNVQPLLESETRKAKRKHKLVDENILIEDATRLDVLLVRSGATINKNAVDREKLRLRKLLETGNSDHEEEKKSGEGYEDNENNEPENNEESSSSGRTTFELFKTNDEVLEQDQLTTKRIMSRTGKSMVMVSKEGYDLDDVSLRSTFSKEQIHGKNKLEDFLNLAILQKEEKRNAEKAENGEGKGLTKKMSKFDRNVQSVVAELAKSNKTLSRKMAFEERNPDKAFLKFEKELRSDNLFAHIGKKNDMERALKLFGYKQSTIKSKKVPLWVGFDEKGKCPVFKKDEPKLSICPFFIPSNKADQFAYIKNYLSQVPKSKLKPDFYPPTWRLFKEQERRALKLHCTNESITEFGIAYVRKFTISGENFMKSAESVYDDLVKSEKSLKKLKKETRNRAIVQLYINNPILFEERKFIIRTFAVIVSGKPFIAYYHDGPILRSIIKYKPFERHDADYKKAAHITSEQKSAQKKILKSSELYGSFNSLQTYLQANHGVDEKYVNKVLRPQLKARMIYSLYSILKRQRTAEDATEEDTSRDNDYKLISTAAVVQTSCFDFLLDSNKKIWLLNIASGSHCFINMGGSSFRPAWKVKMQEALSENTVKLSEEMLWRRMNRKPISSMRFFTKTGMTVLIDETFPDWDVTTEINQHMDGVQVEQDNTDYDSNAENDEVEVTNNNNKPEDAHNENGEEGSHVNADEEED